jgi:hypothetical protein
VWSQVCAQLARAAWAAGGGWKQAAVAHWTPCKQRDSVFDAFIHHTQPEVKSWSDRWSCTPATGGSFALAAATQLAVASEQL